MTNRIGLAVIAGCIAVGSLAVAGCGGGGSSSTTGASGASGQAGSQPLSKADFVAQANQVCANSSDKITALGQQTHSASQIPSYLTKLGAIAEDLNSQLQALTPPAELQAEYQQLLDKNSETISVTHRAVAAAQSGDQQELQAQIAKGNEINAAKVPIAKELGIPNCAKAK
jgi:hypothetical protein